MFCSKFCSSKFRIGKSKPDNKTQLDNFSPFRKFLNSATRVRIGKQKHKNLGQSDITLSFLEKLWNDQNGVCPLTGWQLILPRNASHWYNKDKQSPRRASLDRIDNSKDYFTNNVRFVALMANYARNYFTDEELIEFSNAVTEYNKST